MSYAVKIGTTEASWIDKKPIPDGCVKFDGEVTEKTVWGDDIQNLRLPNDAEIAAALTAAGVVDAEGVQWQADRADLKSKYEAAITRLEAIRDAVSPTNAQVVAALRDVARYQIHILKYIRGL